MGNCERTPTEGHTAEARADSVKKRPDSIIHWFVLIVILLLALWVRMDDLIAWQRQPQRAFYHQRPILINFDGYYYLSLARDLMRHTYAPSDPLRGVPEAQPRPWPPPMISVLAAAAASLTHSALDWIGVLLPPLLGLMLALPLYLLGRLYGGTMMALVATAAGLYAPYYVYRSSLGWFDTDCLNVALAFLVTYLLIRFGLETRRRRFLFLVGALMLSGLFLLWWDQARAVVLLICLSPLLIVVVLFYRPRGRERRVAIGTAAAIIVATMLWIGPRAMTTPFQKAGGALNYISKTQAGAFPNTGLSVFEQKRLGFEDLIEKTTGHLIPFLIGILGLGWLFFRQKKTAAPLLLLFILGCFSFLFARRFLIFLNPFITLGLGFVCQQLWDLRKKWPYLSLAAPAVAVGLCLFPARASLAKIYWPKEIPPLIEGMDRLAQNSTADAVAWAWWDHGYPMLYWSERATINDGSLHSGIRTVCNALPLMDQSQQSAANFMRFYASKGIRGLKQLFDALGSPDRGMRLIQKVMAAGPRNADHPISEAGLSPAAQWRDFFFPSDRRDIYLFLDLRLARTTYWWSWFGTWDPALKDGRHAQFKLIRNCSRQGDRIKGPGLAADLAGGRVTYNGRSYPLSETIIREGARQSRTAYRTPSGLVLVLQKDTGICALMDPSFAGSLFNRLYMLDAPDPIYFSLVAQRYPYYQIWKVTADR